MAETGTNRVAASRIGILGGTFNPVHFGHLILAQSALETHELSKVIFIPCASPPHKDTAGLAAAAHRMAMLHSATESDPRFEISDIEVVRSRPSYSVDTVAQLRQIHKGEELYFIIGLDSLLELHLWKDIHNLLTMCEVVTFVRPGFDLAGIKPDSLRLDPPWPERLLKNVTSARLMEISSSDIRYRLAEGMSIRYLVPEVVEMYIAEHHLYTR